MMPLPFFYLALLASSVAALKVLVDPTGNTKLDSHFHSSFVTIHEARDFVQPLLETMSEDVSVVLAPGVHFLQETFKLTSLDSGRNGHRVVYSGLDSVLNGGVVIRNWQQIVGKSVWEAYAPSLAGTRQLYVNQQRRNRASSPATLLGETTIVTDGTNTGDLEFVYSASTGTPGAPWTESRCGVANITGLKVYMKQPCWSNGRSKNSGSQAIQYPSAIENHLELISEQGQWYFDPRTRMMYYWPMVNEDMLGAVVIAGSVETLVFGSEVRDVTMANLTFAYATWLAPSTGEGFIETQANWILTGAKDHKFAPGSVNFEAATGMVFQNCTFTHLGAQGLVLSKGSSNNKVIGNYFTDISGTGLRIGDVDDVSAPDRGNIVVSNSVWDVCREFHGGVGISGGYLENSVFAHNEIANLPYTGLSLGWGWGTQDQARNNTISFNNIHDTMGVLEDGGNIYVNGVTQGGGTIHDNWLWNYPGKSTANLYLDNGSNQWVCSNNLVLYTSSENRAHWLYLQVDSSYNTVYSNYFEANATQVTGPATNKVFNNIPLSDENFPPQCREIMKAAGPEAPYARHLSHNFAFRRPVTASSTWSSDFNPNSAVDGNPLTSWSPAADNKTYAWFQVDLLQPHVITQVHILMRYDTDELAWSTNFEIWASNHADMSQGHAVIATQQNLAIPFRGLWRADVNDATPYRFVAVVKTDGTHNLSFAELRVF